ncbi:hypothetical protein [Rhodococcus spongiicola]|uniref:Uncharacterized protein n=1 Tax=Rhodococcus spongiicola TaxID=2487352 RepID=A0A3S3DZC6_9NOCA|nr:hypothetical protein [Rhodococcus spongiicola]RVW02384.1 hypothetical protein EF834_12365 [Rhodococcus spongiicola]
MFNRLYEAEAVGDTEPTAHPFPFTISFGSNGSSSGDTGSLVTGGLIVGSVVIGGLALGGLALAG